MGNVFERFGALFGAGDKASDEGVERRLVVGLGNPGSGYRGTRHNAGFDVVDMFAERFGVEVGRTKFGGLFGELMLRGRQVLLLKPESYMNRSGQAVATAAGFYRLVGGQIMVVSDDLALPPGKIRIRAKGSAGGHNGLKDVIARLGHEEFCRLRVGVGGEGGINTKDYVLSRPPADERRLIDEAVVRSVEAIECWIEQGMEAAMNKYNVQVSEQ